MYESGRSPPGCGAILHGMTPTEIPRTELAELYRDLHANPELSFQETRTAGIVADRLTALGYRVHTGIGGTGVVGVLRTITAIATTTETATATRRALLARTRDVHRQGAAFQLVAVKLLDAFLGLLAVRHRDKRETTGTAGELVEDDLDDTDGADLAEEGLEVLGGGGEGEVPHVELAVF